ncbi:hypothetical protein I553_3505 [Mycobacterium xenopi 4042]|uniref:Uncharacterized protein n=1 Tax=Mycobacterium xenopi 4042 TaxID=1299334 RepID=X7ZWN5_MYCXE|nr:hypothetical protein I553_3505 [Mycobacterium xenopi 4042]EUA44163.1 hypothetical protein I552_3935 [Mycobacterium xenopi 3993]
MTSTTSPPATTTTSASLPSPDAGTHRRGRLFDADRPRRYW